MVAAKSSEKAPAVKLFNVVESGSRKIMYDDSLTPYIEVLRDCFREASGKTPEERCEIIDRALGKLMELRRNGGSSAGSGESSDVSAAEERKGGRSYMLF